MTLRESLVDMGFDADEQMRVLTLVAEDRRVLEEELSQTRIGLAVQEKALRRANEDRRALVEALSEGKYLAMSIEELTSREKALREHIIAGDNDTASHIIWHPLIPEWGEIRECLSILKRARDIAANGTKEATRD